MLSSDIDQEIEDFIRVAFEENYEQLRVESGRAITPDVKETALNQAILYWRKLKEIAENITDTEVRLSFPNNSTPAGRNYSIEGVVDLLRDGDQTLMYDIKTHDADMVRANLSLYEQQLNVYAFIWHELREQDLDGMAIIATDCPESIKESLASHDPKMIQYALQDWNPVVPIIYDPGHVDETIHEFGCVVDQIEDGKFSPPPLETLKEALPGSVAIRFATRVCRNCDARFSCSAYRLYMRRGYGRPDGAFERNYSDLEIGESLDEWRTAGLDATGNGEELL